MADESQANGGFSWRTMFPFTHIFRTFRIAIHPSKLMLGLAALILIYVGGQFLDAIWPVQSRVVPNEIDLYQSARFNNRMGEFDNDRDVARKALEANYADLLLSYGVTKDPKVATDVAQHGQMLGELQAESARCQRPAVAVSAPEARPPRRRSPSRTR